MHQKKLQWVLTKEVKANTFDLLALFVLIYKSFDTQGHLCKKF